MTDREKFIVLLDNEQIQKSDVIVLLEGDGLARYQKAAVLYKNGIAPKICFSGNFDDKKSGAYVFEVIRPLLIEEGVREEDLLYENKSRNTYEQAVEIMKMAQLYNWKRITIVASHYHIYRAFLTFLSQQKIMKPDLFIDIASVNDLDWYEQTGYGSRIELLSTEIDKINMYQEKGHVSSYQEGIAYLKWKYSEQKKS